MVHHYHENNQPKKVKSFFLATFTVCVLRNFFLPPILFLRKNLIFSYLEMFCLGFKLVIRDIQCHCYTTAQQPHSNSITPAQQPHSNRITTSQQPHSNLIATTQQPHSNHIATPQQPHSNRIATAKQPHSNNIAKKTDKKKSSNFLGQKH